MDTKHRIWMEKVCVLAEIPHTKMEQEENFDREVLREQLDQGWQGLTSKVAKICPQTRLPNACNKYIGRKDVMEVLELNHMKEINEQIEPLRKMKKN